MLQTHFLLIHFRASIHGLLTLLVSSQEYLLNVLILLLQIQYLGAVHLLPSCARSHCLLLLIARRSIARLALRHRVSQHSLQRMQLVRQQLLLLPRLLQPIAVLTRS